MKIITNEAFNYVNGFKDIFSDVVIKKMHQFIMKISESSYELGKEAANEESKPEYTNIELNYKKYHNLSEEVLAEAYPILFGTNFKSKLNNKSKASELRSIFYGGCSPCIEFPNWLKFIDFLNTKIDNTKNK